MSTPSTPLCPNGAHCVDYDCRLDHLSAPSPPAAENLEDILERAFWRFDALHKAHYRDVAPTLAGPMSERDAFKSAVRHVVLAALGKYAVSE